MNPTTPTERLVPRWAVWLVAVQLVAAEMNYDKIGLPRSVFWVGVCCVPAVIVVLRSEHFLAALTRRPQRALACWIAWMAATLLWTATPVETVRSVAVIAGVWATAVWFVEVYGFDRYLRAITWALACFLTAGLIRDVILVSNSDGIHRFDGYAVHATDLGRIAMLGALVAAVQLLTRTSRTRVDWWCLAASVLALVFTGTRTTMVVFVIMTVAITWRAVGLRHALVLVVATVATAALVFTLIPDPGEFVRRGGDAETISSVNGRESIWNVAFDYIEERPLVGHGFSSGDLLFPLAAQRGDVPIQVPNAHNVLLDITMNQGLVGLALFFIALGSFAGSRITRRASLRSGPRRALRAGDFTGSILVGLLLSGATEAIFGRPTVLFAILGAFFAEAATRRAVVDTPDSSGPSDGADPTSVQLGRARVSG